MTPRLSSLFFLSRCLTLLYDPALTHILRTAISHKKVNWERVVELANVELVTPALWSALVKGGLEEVLDDDLRSYLSELYRLNSRRNADIRRQVEEIVLSLNRIGVEPLLLKGAALLFAHAYGDLIARVMTDIDVMVQIDDLTSAVDALSTLGYKVMEEEVAGSDENHHYPPMSRAGDPAIVEIHTRLGDEIDDRMLLTVPEIWQDSVIINRKGLTFRFMSVSHSVFYNVIHSELHHGGFELGRISPRNLLDLAVMCRHHSKEIDWSDMEIRMKRYGLHRVLRSYLHMGARLFRAPVPAAINVTTGSKLHYARCLLVAASRPLHLLNNLCLIPKKVCRLFGAKTMQDRFACGNSMMDLTRTRLTYAVYLVKVYIWGPRRHLLVHLLLGTEIKDSSQRKIRRRQD